MARQVEAELEARWEGHDGITALIQFQVRCVCAVLCCAVLCWVMWQVGHPGIGLCLLRVVQLVTGVCCVVGDVFGVSLRSFFFLGVSAEFGSLSVSVSACLPVCLSVCLSVCLTVLSHLVKVCSCGSV